MADEFDHIHPLDPGRKPRGYWTEDRVLIAAKCFSDSEEWRVKHPPSYDKAHRFPDKPHPETGETTTFRDWVYFIAYGTTSRKSRIFPEDVGGLVQLVVDSKAKNRRELAILDNPLMRAINRHDFSEEVYERANLPRQKPGRPKGAKSSPHCKEVQTVEGCATFMRKNSIVGGSDWRLRFPSEALLARRAGVDEEAAKLAGFEIQKYAAWDRDSALREASKYKNYTDFKNNAGGAYTWVYANGLVREFADILGWDMRAENGFYADYENVRKAAEDSGARTFGTFRRINPGAAAGAMKYGHVDRLSEDFNWTIGEHDHDAIDTVLYEYEQDGYFYVGVTRRVEERRVEHANGERGSLVSYYMPNAEPEYLTRVARHSGERVIYEMTKNEAERHEARRIREAARTGKKVINKDKNPQYDPKTKTFSWEEDLDMKMATA